MADINYKIIKKIAVLSESSKGWRKEVNLISWNDAAPKYDIRDWAPDHEKIGKGVTLTEEEMRTLINSVTEIRTSTSSDKENESDAITGGMTIEELINKWDAIVKTAPESIKEYLIPSRLNIVKQDTVAVGLKRGNAYTALLNNENRECLIDFVGNIIGRRINVELIESSWI